MPYRAKTVSPGVEPARSQVFGKITSSLPAGFVRRIENEHIALKVNGKVHALDVDPATPLLYIYAMILACKVRGLVGGLGQCAGRAL